MVRDIGKRRTRIPTSDAESLRVDVKSFGPTPQQIRALTQRVTEHKAVRKFLAKTRNRLLQMDLLDAEAEDKTAKPEPPRRFQAVFYDYTNNRAVIATGSLDRPGALEVTESSRQPLPSREEFDEALRILGADPELGPALREDRLTHYPPMPPLIGEVLQDGRVERTLAIGLLPRSGSKGHEIVGVDLLKRKVTRFAPTERGRAPTTSAAHNPICGQPVANQPTARGVAGSVAVTVKRGNTTLWTFQVVRPAASSGTNGSGIELRYVNYRGKRVLYRAHVPILNVKYEGNACGPYRDWQNEEGMIQAAGVDVAPGFRLCPNPATTILDTGNDTGSFLGVAIYVQGQEIVLVSEMQAGWYRYISEWRLHADGTIRPRFGFSAVTSSCVCNIHHHHCYWRLDFDIRTAGNNIVREFNDPALFPRSHWHDKHFEIQRPRDPARQRKWRVANKITGEAYDIIPGPNDGVATSFPDWPFPRGDVWVLRYHGNEVDDGVHAVGPPYEAGLDQWVNGESVHGQDVVVWYGAHFTHNVHEEGAGFGHVVGPDLKLVKW